MDLHDNDDAFEKTHFSQIEMYIENVHPDNILLCSCIECLFLGRMNNLGIIMIITRLLIL